MSYDGLDDSVKDGSPATLYAIEIDNKPFFYTDHQRPLTRTVKGAVRTFQPNQINRSAISYAYDLNDASKVDVELPISDPVSYLVNGLVTPQFITVDIYETHVTDPAAEVKALLFGFITDVDANTTDKTTTLSVASLIHSHLNNDVSSVYYSRVCNHDFGDERCRFDIESVARDVIVTGVRLWQVQVNALNIEGFEGGRAKIVRTGVAQHVVDVQGDTLFTLGGFSDIVVGDVLRLYPGCDHIIDGDCLTQYNNTINFGGYPRVPRKNPFVKGFGEVDLSDGGAS